MRKWTGKPEASDVYEFLVEERAGIENKIIYDLQVDYLTKSDHFWFYSLPAVRSFLSREYGKHSLKLVK